MPQHELYAGGTKKSLLFSRKAINSLMELSVLNYTKSCRNSDKFREGVDNYMVKGDYPDTAYTK